MTIVPTSASARPGQLRAVDHANLGRRVKRALFGLPFRWMVGGFDFSLNEHQDGRYAAHWLPHLYLIGESSDPVGLRAGLKRRFAPSDAVPRPVKPKLWDRRWNALFYAYKVDAYRRVGLDGEVRFDPVSGVTRACGATQRQRLRSAERLELSLHLDELGPGKRLFAARAQLHHRRRRIEIRLLRGW